MSVDAPLELRAEGSGAVLGIRAQPGARREGVVGTWNGRLKVALRAPARDGRANAELLEVLARALGLRAGELELLRGPRSRLKDVALPLSPEEVRRRLLPLLGGGQ